MFDSLLFMRSHLLRKLADLLFLGFLVTSSLGLGFGHELSLLGLAIPASTLVVDAAIGVDPDFAAGLGGRDLRTGSCRRRGLGDLGAAIAARSRDWMPEPEPPREPERWR